MTDGGARRGVFGLEAIDPSGDLVDRAGLGEDDIVEIGRIMNAMARLREVEQQVSEASQRYMKLNRTDMRALHFLIVVGGSGEIATAGSIADHLGITTASTTKLLDRLEEAGHVRRMPHPRDRRALAVEITEATRIAATDTVGRIHARRAYVAARLTSDERETVASFFEAMADALDGASFPDAP